MILIERTYKFSFLGAALLKVLKGVSYRNIEGNI